MTKLKLFRSPGAASRRQVAVRAVRPRGTLQESDFGPHPRKPCFPFGGELHRLMGAVAVPTACVPGRFGGVWPVRMRRGIRAPPGSRWAWMVAFGRVVSCAAAACSCPGYTVRAGQHGADSSATRDRRRRCRVVPPDPRPLSQTQGDPRVGRVAFAAAIQGRGARYLGEWVQHQSTYSSAAYPLASAAMPTLSRLPAQQPSPAISRRKLFCGEACREHACIGDPAASGPGQPAMGLVTRAARSQDRQPPGHSSLQQEPRQGTDIPHLS